MATVALTAENFNQYVEKDGVLVIDWWAPWCGPCRTFGPIYDKASDKHTDVTFGKINTEEQPDLAGTFQIQAIPTLMVFRDQVLVFAQPGVVPAAALDDLISQVQGLDMDDVRKKIAEQEAQDELEQTGNGDLTSGPTSDLTSNPTRSEDDDGGPPPAAEK